MKANKKVKNATITVVDGIKFRSKLEAYMFGLLRQFDIPFNYEKERFVLVDKFRYSNETVRAITYTPDFSGDSFIIETKGYPTPEWKLRFKLFKLYCNQNGETRKVFVPTSKEECMSTVREIKERRSGS